MATFSPQAAVILDMIENVIDLDDLLQRAKFPDVDRDVVRQVVEAGADFVRERVAPHAAEIDSEGCSLVDGRVRLPAAFSGIWKSYVEGGWISLSIPQAHGGLGFPTLIQAAISEMVCGASIAVSMLPLLSRGAVGLVAAHANEAVKQVYLRKLVSGQWAATICITEPQAGSDVAAIKTKAQKHADGTWSISGTKIFISFGDHDLTEGILHIVLARTDDPTRGVGGLGLFAVPVTNGPERNNAVIPLRVEHKLGLNGSPTCALSFDRAAAFPLGAACAGLKTIFSMINTMRLEVAVQGVGVAAAATQAATHYAQERIQGRDGLRMLPIVEHPDVRRNLLTMDAYVEGSRALVYQTAKLVDLAQNGRDAETRKEAAQLAAFLLPVCKAGCSDAAVELASTAMQVHGGHGYIRETGIERLYRDARILPIYEGTNAIQAIDLVFRKLLTGNGTLSIFMRNVCSELAYAKDVGAPDELLDGMNDALHDFRNAAELITRRVNNDKQAVLAVATPFLDLVYKVAIGWALLKVVSRSRFEQAHKHTVARFYASQILPETKLVHDIVKNSQRLQ
jgi:alkylation response protein AidB-like acyl-CoA dehydrogenase